MTNTSQKTKLSTKDILKKGFIIISGGAFVWFSVAGVIKMMTTPTTPPANSKNQQESSPEARLKKEMEGYQLVLDKEPNNLFALDALLRINLQLRDLSASLPLAEKLVKLQPRNQKYQEVLENIKKGLAAEKTKTEPSSNITDKNEKK